MKFIFMLLFSCTFLLGKSYSIQGIMKEEASNYFSNPFCEYYSKEKSKYIEKVCIKKIEIKYKISTLLGEPTTYFNVKWESNPEIYIRGFLLYSGSSYNIRELSSSIKKAYSNIKIISPTYFVSHFIIHHNYIANMTFNGDYIGKANTAGFSVTGSPNWNKLLSHNEHVDCESYKKDRKFYPRDKAIQLYGKKKMGGPIRKLTIGEICSLTFSGIHDLNRAISKDCKFEEKACEKEMKVKEDEIKKAEKIQIRSKNLNVEEESKWITDEKIKNNNKQEVITKINKESKWISRIPEMNKINSTDIKNNKMNPKNINTKASLLMLIDISGSMSGEKLEAAKNAAKEGSKTAINEFTEIAILAFEGNCSAPISKKLDFTMNLNKIYSFVDSLKAKGGTPLGNALKEANNYLLRNKSVNSKIQMILLLADGNDECKNTDNVMNQLKSKGIVFRHDTVGLGIDSDSNAAKDLKNIAKKSGGKYHHTNNPKQLSSIFLESIETMKMIEIIGNFGEMTKKDISKSIKKEDSSFDRMNSILDNFE